MRHIAVSSSWCDTWKDSSQLASFMKRLTVEAHFPMKEGTVTEAGISNVYTYNGILEDLHI